MALCAPASSTLSISGRPVVREGPEFEVSFLLLAFASPRVTGGQPPTPGTEPLSMIASTWGWRAPESSVKRRIPLIGSDNFAGSAGSTTGLRYCSTATPSCCCSIEAGSAPACSTPADPAARHEAGPYSFLVCGCGCCCCWAACWRTSAARPGPFSSMAASMAWLNPRFS